MHFESVQTGIDVLEADGFSRLMGSRVGLVTNHTGRTSDGRATIDVLFHAPNMKLAALFGPEHGIRGEHDEDVADGFDTVTGLSVYSLFGARTRPTAEQLDTIDTLAFDIQDIGCRFYTYISTLGNILQAASDAKLRVLVLDRPNPITGAYFEGPLADPDKLSFTAFHPIPIRHGMTVGEMARLFVSELNLACELEVVTCRGWQRSDWYDSTNLPWVNPSPNMRSLYAATLYPGIGLLEFTNISVGRGTDRPFELLGAPFIEARTFASELNRTALPGIRFIPTSFSPTESVYAKEQCNGVAMVVTDRCVLDAVLTGVTIGVALKQLYPDSYQSHKLMTLLANQKAFDAFHAGVLPNEIVSGWQIELSGFAERRETALLY